jgi:hypothetical protein
MVNPLHPNVPEEAPPPEPQSETTPGTSVAAVAATRRGRLISRRWGGATLRLPGSALDDRTFISDHIKSPRHSEVIREVEVRLNNPVEDGNHFSFESQLPNTVLAGKLMAFPASI